MPKAKSVKSRDKSRSPDLAIAQPKPIKPRDGQRAVLRAALKKALYLMGVEGLPIHEAAQQAGMTLTGLRAALRKPHIKQVLNNLIREVRENAGQAAWLRINHMAIHEKSPAVRLDANKWVAGVDNIAPLKRVEGKMQINHGFSGFVFARPEPKNITPPDTESGDDIE